MHRSKKDVDKHVENLLSKLSSKEFTARAYSLARLYFEVGDYASCQRYVEQYLSQKDSNAAAHKLLGQTFLKLGKKEKALEQFKSALDIDPMQNSLYLDVCELLADEEVFIEPGRAKYWCDKAEAIFPRHPVTFRLRERLLATANSDPEALVNLLKSELSARPNDVTLHARLLKHYLHINNIKEAFDHSCNLELDDKPQFRNNSAWYDTLAEIVKHNALDKTDWRYQVLILTVKERLCVLSLTETPSGNSKSLVESSELLHQYDQALKLVSNAGSASGCAQIHASLLQHHYAQFAFHSATFLLKKAKKNQITWRDASKLAAPLMLIAWHSVPLDPKVNWLTRSPKVQLSSAQRWYLEGVFRCSQAGHYLLANTQDKSQSFLDSVSQYCSATHWRDKLYEKLFPGRDQLAKIKTSYFVSHGDNNPMLRIPRRPEVEAYDADAQRLFPNSLHHFVWILSNYKNYGNFSCTLFNMLTAKSHNYINCGSETLNKYDILAYLFCAALTLQQKKSNPSAYDLIDKPSVIPANITDSLCTLTQIKWWDCAYKFSQNELGTELSDIRVTLSRGIEVVRCVDNHGLDPELLTKLGRIFSDKAENATSLEEKNGFETRAVLYYSSGLLLLEKIKSKLTVQVSDKRMFDYTHKELTPRDLHALIEECKVYLAVNYINENDNEKAIGLLANLKSAKALFHLSQAYKNMAQEELNLSKENINTETKSKCAMLLSKAKTIAYKSLERIKTKQEESKQSLSSETQELIEDIEMVINKMDLDLSALNEYEGKYSSDENLSSTGSEHLAMRNSHLLRNLSSTPKQPSNNNGTHYRSAIDSQLLENSSTDQRYLERIESQIKNLQKRDSTINSFMEQTKCWFDENRNLGNQIMSSITSNMQNTTDQFKLLKLSVDQVKDQIDECRIECKDVGELKKQIADLKKEVNKLKKASSEQTIDDNELYNLEDEYRTSDSSSNFAAQLPFNPPVIPPFNQRIVPPFPVPPNPYQLYGQNLYNLYSQYSQFAQAPPVAAAPPIFDSTRPQMNYGSVFPTPEQMYPDVSQLLPSAVPVPAPMPTAAIPPVSIPKPAPLPCKETIRSLPANVVITSSDPLPTCTAAPPPVLSVTIPPKHIKGTHITPHNYQIQMPTGEAAQAVPPNIFGGGIIGNSSNLFSNAARTFTQSASSTPKVSSSANNSSHSLFDSPKVTGPFDSSITVVDGKVVSITPNNSLNKSRTLSEQSNTSVENYDPCPNFKPIIPLPAEVKVTTGEEDEIPIFSARAKLFRFVEKQWKDRGIGEIKLLKHKETSKVRVLMRREQVHKICANHIITPEMEIQPMANETKAYFWVANDFAEETVVLEKFCIRFKTPEIAKQFYESFEKARQDAKYLASNARMNKTLGFDTVNLKTLPKNDKVEQVESKENKTVIGGFTFSSKPTLKALKDETPENKNTDGTTTKLNPFSGITFKSSANSPFSNLLNLTPQNKDTTPLNNEATSSPLNTSDVVEEYEPNVDFKPVVPLPALVEAKTGEEDEIVLYEQRSKLLRYEGSTKEWKERGLGLMKLLVNKDNSQKLRLLMRREQVMKVCCNHSVTKDITFQKMPNMDKAVTWCAKDFSEGQLVPETFCLRFKTVEACDKFIEAVRAAQLNINDDSKSAKEEQNAAKQIGFGDQFKPKAGSWQCESCYTNNLESFINCACCEQPKPLKDKTAPKSKAFTAPSGWGDKFKPKPGTWECVQCLIRNDENTQECTACNSPKDPSAPKKETKPIFEPSKFSFGIPTQKEAPEAPKFETTTALTPSNSWGDKFKMKEGMWECQNCFVRNDGSLEDCSACNSQRDPNAAKKDTKSLFGGAPTGPKFSFGIPATVSNEEKAKPASSIFDGTGAHKFSFGIPTDSKANNISTPLFGNKIASVSTSMFGSGKYDTQNEAPINFSLTKKEESNIVSTPTKTALLPTPQTESDSKFGLKDGGTFDFVFKPKPPTKSPLKSPRSEKGEDSEDNEYASEDEGHHIHFNPIVPLPDKVEVVTGEENEDELYGHRAKLFRFTSGEWKERGIGVVKLLRHKTTGKLRIVMRREQVLKICLNHALTPEVIYSPKDDKTWLFTANDFSEGELSLSQFCLRFKTKEIAQDFKDAIEKSRPSAAFIDKNSDTDSDDVIFVSEIHATSEQKKMAKELMLPENFFTYKTKEPCQGCRGCEDDDNMAVPQVSVTTTPFTSPTASDSIYGTPSNFNRTIESSPFRTPFSSIGSNANQSTLFKTSVNSEKGQENTVIPTPSVFSGNGGQKSPFFSPSGTPGPTAGAGDVDAAKGSVLAAPKLSLFNSTNENDKSEAKSLFAAAAQSQTKSVFGNTENKSIFNTGTMNTSTAFSAAPEKPKFTNLFGNVGAPTNKSIFGFANDKTEDKKESPEVKSIFGNDQEPANLFSAAVQGAFFGPGAPKPNKPAPASTLFGSNTGTSIFGSSEKPTWPFGHKAQQDDTSSIFSNNSAISTADEKPIDKKESIFKVDNSLSFAALSTSGPGFDAQKKTDFTWDGAGQQLFNAGSSKKDDSQTKNESGAGEDEEYDPHYEPIVPLPDKIVVTTGEEDEEKIYAQRCKLYRYNDKTREWKERGVGEMKILYHPERNTYRLLLRREQIHKAVLNMLLHMDMEVLPMNNSDRAWTWAGVNYAESASGEMETLAVRFKTVDLATAFRDKTVECVRKLQAAAAQNIREKKETPTFDSIAPLRLPKHLQDSARADQVVSAVTAVASQSVDNRQNGNETKPEPKPSVHFEQPEQEEEEDEDDDDEHNYDEYEDYEAYYNEENGLYFSCEAAVSVRDGDSEVTCGEAQVQVLFDQELYAPKILLTDAATGEILADMLVHTETDFQMSGDSCSWSGTDYTSNEPAEKSVTVHFAASYSAAQFFDSCETSKAAAYTSTDPDS